MCARRVSHNRQLLIIKSENQRSECYCKPRTRVLQGAWKRGEKERKNIIDEDSPFQKYIPALDREKFKRISIQRKRRVKGRRRGVGCGAKRRGGGWKKRRTGDYPVGRYRRAAGNWSVLRERSTRAPRAHGFFFLLLFLHARPARARFPFFPRAFCITKDREFSATDARDEVGAHELSPCACVSGEEGRIGGKREGGVVGRSRR